MSAVRIYRVNIVAIYIVAVGKIYNMVSTKLISGRTIKKTYIALFHTQWYLRLERDTKKKPRAYRALLP